MGGRWKSQNRKNVYLSPYVEEPLNSKVIKSFVPELRSRKCFGIPMFYVYVKYVYEHFMDIMSISQIWVSISNGLFRRWKERVRENTRPPEKRKEKEAKNKKNKMPRPKQKKKRKKKKNSSTPGEEKKKGMKKRKRKRRRAANKKKDCNQQSQDKKVGHEKFTFIPERDFIFARVKTGQTGT